MNIDDWKDLGSRQEAFAEALAQLLAFARKEKISVRVKDAYRDERLHGRWGEKKGYGAAFSLHKLSLAVDLWAHDPMVHIALHDFWDAVGGAQRIAGDMGHYSFSWQGYR